jgi:peptidoglycan/LPS O-acetylase OafA/YrhL
MSPKELPHYNALDGLRGAAVSMVVLFHFWQTLPKYEHPLSAGVTRVLGLMLIGQKGVDLFFVLSGFLITGILLRTKGSNNYFSTFYIRRSLRIFPLYFMVVIACLLAGVIWNLPQYSWHNTWWYLLYLQNVARTFWPGSIDGPGHFWSLAVEEHFYLFWPLAVLLASRRALVALCVFLILMPIVMRAWFIHMGLDVFTFTLCRIDTLAMGALIAVMFENAGQRAAVVRWSRWSFLPIVVLSFGSFFVLSGSAGPLLQTFKYTLFALLCSLILVLALSPGRFNVAPRMFNVAALRGLGKISYAMYVFHPFVLAWAGRRLYSSVGNPFYGKFYAAVLSELAIYLILTIVVARLSWILFEQPILKLKDRFRYVASAPAAAAPTIASRATPAG